MLAQREHSKNMSVFERTQRKIVSNYCIKQWFEQILFRKYCAFLCYLLLLGIDKFNLKIQRKCSEFSFCKGWQYFTRQKKTKWKDLHCNN